MLQPEEAKAMLNDIGISAKKVSEKTGMCYSYIVEYLNNRRSLTADQMVKLEIYFDKLRKIL